ncbi:hypothetical protein BG005_004815 [Podila minutissima]|nr:hypothetical protein BG005_004815 [Podila minutissima]
MVTYAKAQWQIFPKEAVPQIASSAGPKSYPNIDQLPTIIENDSQAGTSPHVRMEAENKTKTDLSKAKVQEPSQPLAGADVPQVHVPSDDNTVDLAVGSAKPRGAMSKDKSTKAKPTGGSPVARNGDKVVTKKSGKNTDRIASSGETRTMHILGPPKQTSVHHRLLGRESLKQLSPGELLKKMNKKLLGRSQTPVLKNTQLPDWKQFCLDAEEHTSWPEFEYRDDLGKWNYDETPSSH